MVGPLEMNELKRLARLLTPFCRNYRLPACPKSIAILRMPSSIYHAWSWRDKSVKENSID